MPVRRSSRRTRAPVPAPLVSPGGRATSSRSTATPPSAAPNTATRPTPASACTSTVTSAGTTTCSSPIPTDAVTSVIPARRGASRRSSRIVPIARRYSSSSSRDRRGPVVAVADAALERRVDERDDAQRDREEDRERHESARPPEPRGDHETGADDAERDRAGDLDVDVEDAGAREQRGDAGEHGEGAHRQRPEAGTRTRRLRRARSRRAGRLWWLWPRRGLGPRARGHGGGRRGGGGCRAPFGIGRGRVSVWRRFPSRRLRPGPPRVRRRAARPPARRSAIPSG